MSDTQTAIIPRPKAYSYIRFSSPEQMKGDSYRRQDEGARKYALEHDLDLDESLVFEDLGTSAYRGKHAREGALSRFLEAVKEGTIRPGSTLIIENLDRLSREDALTAFDLLSSLMNQDITVVTLHDGAMYTRELLSKNMGTLMMALGAMYRAHEESDTKSKRLSKSWEHKREDARAQGKAMTSTCPHWLKLDKATGKYLIIEDRADIVRRIFTETLEGKGAVVIVKQLNAEGMPPFGRSKGWWESYVKKILANEAVFGRLQPYTTKAVEGRRVPVGEPVEDYYPAIVDRETFYRAQTMRQERRIPGGRTVAKFSNLFTGLVKCGVCGATMAFDNKGTGPGRGTYLVCADAKRKLGTCARHAWRYPLAQTHILLNLHSLDYRNLLPDIARQAQDEAQTLERQLEAMRSELAEAVGKVDNLADQIAESPSQALRRALDRVEARQLELEASIELMTSQLEGARGRSFEAEAVADESEEAFKAFIAAEQEGEPGQVYEMRRRMHQILLRQLDIIKFYPASPDTPSLYGIIEIAFKGTGRIHRIKVDKGQVSSKGYRVLEDGAEELHIDEPNAVWPPDGILMNGRALAAELGLDL